MKFSEPVFTNEDEAVISYKGEKYSVKIDINHDIDGVPSECKVSFDREYSADLSTTKPKYLDGYIVKWGGWPFFRQKECVPISDNGDPYDYLCTVESPFWGDSGVCNIFILTKKVECDTIKDSYHYEVVDVYMDYGCC